MLDEIEIRPYRRQDLPALVELTNQADTFDRMERPTTLAELEHDMGSPHYYPETDCFLAWEGDRLAGYADLFLRVGETGKENFVWTWGVVHPQWRRRGLGRRLMERLWRRAEERLPEIERGPVYFQGSGRIEEEDRAGLFRSLGMAPLRYFVNLARPIDNGLPPVDLPAGYRFRSFDPERDVETAWRVDSEAFRDHWGFDGWPLDEFRHWMEMPNFRPELWLLAEEEATAHVVGLAFNRINPDWIATTGRQEGLVNTLGVLSAHRHRGLGAALLAQSLRTLRQAGMAGAHLYADADNLTGAMRLYERLGFRLRKTNVSYARVMRPWFATPPHPGPVARLTEATESKDDRRGDYTNQIRDVRTNG
jgi:mycothiol synthase